MNRKLLDPFEPEYPETIEACLDDEYATCCAYIWDMDTLNIVRKLTHGDAPLMGVRWSRSSRHVLTYDDAGLCILWDLQTNTRTCEQFDAPILDARVHPRNPHLLVVCPMKGMPWMVTAGGTRTRLEIEGQATCCCFGKKGKHMFFGTTKGYVHVVETETLAPVCSLRLSSSRVGSLAANARAPEIVASSSDRTLRVCRLTDNSLSAVFSASGDYIIAGIEHRAEHNIYVWDKLAGSLVKVLDGPNELLEDCAVHPLRPIIASVSTFGLVYLWTRLEENIDHDEPEDEFDKKVTYADGHVVVINEERARKDRPNPADEEEGDVFVDITDNDPFFSDSASEMDDDGFILPVEIRGDDGDDFPLADAPLATSKPQTPEPEPATGGQVIVEPQ
ncbi:WD40 repeat-like protein [Linderina pennispora]|uniref:WD40 repeat-like protein n=1 Tax=Linderina pennispora TaxID=61395 RepID=A0A1Y1WM38_9FUNG|nr:WD40 repeat-like protein [Linderina pennispora]ORX74154.1 WD40 repeat-like protein [Linderina pennispora]